MSHKFKVGDKVICKKASTICTRFEGLEGEVMCLSCIQDGEPSYVVVYPDGYSQVASEKADEMVLASVETSIKGNTFTIPFNDPVNNPQHYGQGSIECIDYIQDFLTKDEYIGYLRGNIAKYLHRWRYKNGLEDLKKASWYLDRLIREMGGEE